MDKGDKRLTSSFQVTLLGQTKSIFGPCPTCSHIVPISKGHLSVSSTDAESEVDLVDNLVGRIIDNAGLGYFRSGISISSLAFLHKITYYFVNLPFHYVPTAHVIVPFIYLCTLVCSHSQNSFCSKLPVNSCE